MNGYQYAQIHVNGPYDPEYVYLAGSIECTAWDQAVIDYADTPQYIVTAAESNMVYEKMGSVFLSDLLVPEAWSYYNAYAIYDYLNYQYEHNISAHALLNSPALFNPATNISYFDTLRWYADQQQYAQLGNMYAKNNISSTAWPAGIQGSVSTLPGNLLAAKMLAQLQGSIWSSGVYYKLSLLFSDYQPLVSLFALLDLPPLDSNFYALPEFGSAVVFELFSNEDDPTSADYPSEDDLWVRFYFRNGTNPDEPYRAYSLFNNGPDMPDMPWGDFQRAMFEIAIGDVGDWCTQCGAEMLMCAPWNSTDAINVTFDSSSSSGHGSVSPAVGGVIGAIFTLVVAGMLFGAAMLIGGVRLHRVNKSHKSELGGFKGSQKMASDKDLIIPKGGAIVGATVETPGSPMRDGHERVGSWELKQNEAGLPNIAAPEAARRPSFDDDDLGDLGASPISEPVKADERV